MKLKAVISCEEFERMAHDLGPCELIDGEIVLMSPGGFDHSVCTTRICVILDAFVTRKHLGRVLTNEAGLHVRRKPPRSRGADIAYVSYKRIPRSKRPRGFLRVPPELIVEVFGSDLTWPKMKGKIADYHGFGVEEVWVVDPRTRTLKRFPRGAVPSILREGDAIDGGTILPGFRVPIARFFEGL